MRLHFNFTHALKLDVSSRSPVRLVGCVREGSADSKATQLPAYQMEERNYESALNALGTLISSLKRSDGSKWEDAFRAMHTFLEASPPIQG